MPARIAWVPTRVFCGLIALCTGSWAAATWAAEEFPYQAYVLSENVDVVAGPGHRFYVTDRLTRGTQVEIYREEASGWLAIRPPEGSFSWIPAEFVERLEDDQLGRVTEPTGAWIGTSVEHVSEHQQQVTLKAGELVQILGEKSTAAKEGEKRTWLKISPPAGEYRWVHLRDVGRQKPADPPPSAVVKHDSEEKTATIDQPETAQEPRRIELAGIPQALRDLEERRSRLDRQVEPAQFRSNAGGAGVSPSPDGFVPRRRRGEEAAAPASSGPAFSSTGTSPARPRLDPDSRMATATPARPISAAAGGSAIRGGLSNDQIARELDQIEVDLSLMVAQDRSQWNLAALRRRVDTLVEGGADPAARGRARLVLEKIRQFENAFEAGSSDALSPAGQAGSGALASTGTGEKTKSLADPRYDAQGWLKPVVSKKSKTPAAPYAVVDSEGQPLCFVSPSPGLNLNRYLNKQVGLYGRRGYMEELKKPHVVAERVIELNTQLR